MCRLTTISFTKTLNTYTLPTNEALCMCVCVCVPMPTYDDGLLLQYLESTKRKTLSAKRKAHQVKHNKNLKNHMQAPEHSSKHPGSWLFFVTNNSLPLHSLVSIHTGLRKLKKIQTQEQALFHLPLFLWCITITFLYILFQCNFKSKNEIESLEKGSILC